MKKTVIFVGLFVFVGFVGFYFSFDNQSPEVKDVASSESLWSIGPGYRIDFASNPRIMSYEDGKLELGYQSNTVELLDHPSESGYIAISYDGYEFEEGRQFAPGESFGNGLEMLSGTYRRFMVSPDGVVTSASSLDRENWVLDAGNRLEIEIDEGERIGVSTFFVDKFGGIVMLYNHDVYDDEGHETILVGRAYSEPSDNGMNFVVTDEQILEMYDEKGRMMSFADPNAVLLPDGRVRLVVMYQDPDNGYPPQGKNGTLYSFVSFDGANFALEEEIVSWDDFEEFEVVSLNDPKLLVRSDGTEIIYVAALIPATAGEQGTVGNYKYVIVSLTKE
ncbi:hypothetical protein COT83_04720 [Candidatus Peregrinibacteria bacterium CG10_big_fil_rev_8_21_14_0_10_44_7]|nr:MAG: hypothetical protein AUK45_00785 [Candidatus Peregrinibacteria bacterium CG2_30_44_17]PIS03691.1 MAG: hypothetical protein COT83_04720 [Candidatus Peregrinibacteria bacterium CG10_big_fil_rev_8_21_14_0_10_44_7]PIX79822.1 MAG: hypothetical protein COZ35_02575 [Candidatus Peregrinibacteria bacterium CG_4_10_14_3_um_filter_44_21]PJB88470.1 MAG: hypothetical protein CO082_04340 [Candidatus Peregrinibacteria bacterium CG_4_9_14_0_8_um_filter_44_15]